MTSQKILDSIKKYKIILIIVLFACLACSFISTLFFLINNSGIVDDVSHIPDNNPLLNSILSYPDTTQDINETPTLSRAELDNKLYESIKSKFNVEDKGNCESTITSQTFKSITLDFNNCKWDFSINDSTKISLSAMAIYVHNFLIFTNKITHEQVEVEFFFPGVFEYIGPVAVCYSNKDIVTKVSDSIYKFNQEALNDEINTHQSSYLSSESVVLKGDSDFDELVNHVYDDIYAVSYANSASKENAQVCIRRGPDFMLKADYTQEELEIFKQLYSYDKTFSPSSILSVIRLYKNQATTNSDELLSGFTLN